MIAVITGDIVGSRQLNDASRWLVPFKALLNEWGNTPNTWEIYRGDSFQLEVKEPEDALYYALRIKAVIKSIPPDQSEKRIGPLDVRLAIGIGEKKYESDNIAESNGSAFVNSGEQLDELKRKKATLAIRSPWRTFDHDMNLYLRLASMAIDEWTVSAAEAMQVALAYPELTQSEIGDCLGIEQNSVNYRLKRAHAEEVMEVEAQFKRKLKEYATDTR